MPRINPRINITAEIRQDLRCGLSVHQALHHASRLTTRPDTWLRRGRGYVQNIYQELVSQNRIDSSRRQQRLAQINPQARQQTVQNTQPQEHILDISQVRPNPVRPSSWTPRPRRSRFSRRPSPVTPAPTDEIPATANSNETFEIDAIGNFDSTKTFGIEIEFLIPHTLNFHDLARKLTENGISAQTESYNHEVRDYWKITTDGSVRSHLRDYNGQCEIISPILKGMDGLQQIVKVCKTLESLKIKVNKTCGLHIHHGCKLCYGRINTDTIARNAVLIYSKYQSKFNKMMPASRRNQRYAHPATHREVLQLQQGNLQIMTDRYRVVNTRSYWNQGTVEFRQHSGTIEAKKIINWIKITQMVMIRAYQMINNDLANYAWRKFEVELGFNRNITSYIQSRFQRFQSINNEQPEAAVA